MKPTFIQLRNRIKYVELLRSGKLREAHGTWDSKTCGVCAIGAAMRVFRAPRYGQIISYEQFLNYSFAPFGYLDGGRHILSFHPVGKSERQMLSQFYGWNYLEIKGISDEYEGWDQKARSLIKAWNSLNHAQIADWVEARHIKPYIWMIEKGHEERIRNKTKKELSEVHV